MNRPTIALLLLGQMLVYVACAGGRAQDDSGTQVMLADPYTAEAPAVVTDAEVAGTSTLGREELEELAARADGGGVDSPHLLAELAVSLAFSGETDVAKNLAIQARAAGADGRAEDLTDVILEDRLGDLLPAPPVIGVVVPVSGSPSRREYANLFLEGAEVAARLARRVGIPVEIVVHDNRGTPMGSARGVTAAVRQGAVAILGPLADEGVSAAARAKPSDVALFSPTARRLPIGPPGVYSLGGGDPGAAETLAEAVAELGFREAVVVHPASAAERLEAATFVSTFTDLGGSVQRQIDYLPGTTTFAEPMNEVAELAPELLVIAAPADDVELLAPQFSFFGLDTLDIQVAGTADWTVPQVIDAVARRHTDRVIAVSGFPPGSSTVLESAFVRAYEDHFKKTLQSPVPAVGFDLLRLAIAAYGESARTGRSLIEALEGRYRFRGVTGTYSVEDSRLVREFFPVKIFARSLLPIDSVLPEPTPPGVR